MTWQAEAPKYATAIGGGVAVQWQCGEEHEHTIECLWVWHDCAEILGPQTIAPGERFGWRPSGVAAHTLVQQDPLTITASVYWPECCNLHGFITDGRWLGV